MVRLFLCMWIFTRVASAVRTLILGRSRSATFLSVCGYFSFLSPFTLLFPTPVVFQWLLHDSRQQLSFSVGVWLRKAAVSLTGAQEDQEKAVQPATSAGVWGSALSTCCFGSIRPGVGCEARWLWRSPASGPGLQSCVWSKCSQSCLVAFPRSLFGPTRPVCLS